MKISKYAHVAQYHDQTVASTHQCQFGCKRSIYQTADILCSNSPQTQYMQVQLNVAIVWTAKLLTNTDQNTSAIRWGIKK